MERSHYTDLGSRQPYVPAGTPPVIDANADPRAAADITTAGGDSHAPGSQPAHFNQGHGGDRDYPGEQPDEIVPDQGDTDVPDRTPDEVAPGQGDFDRPDSSPIEMPPQPDVAPETPPPPD